MFRVDLLPAEIRDGRQSARLRTRVGVLLLLLLVLVLLGWGAARLAVSVAEGQLAQAREAGAALQAEERSLADVAAVVDEQQAVESALQAALANHVALGELLTQIRAAAPEGLSITGITVSAAAPSSTAQNAGGPSGVLDGSGDELIGRIVVTVTASERRLIPEFVSALVTVDPLAVPYLQSERVGSEGTSEATIQLSIADRARSLNYEQDGGAR